MKRVRAKKWATWTELVGDLVNAVGRPQALSLVRAALDAAEAEPARITRQPRSEGERVRLRHSIRRSHTTLRALETAMTLPGPIGHETAESIVLAAAGIALGIAKLDAYSLAESDAAKERPQ